jgi:hypothetical protein
MRLFNTKSQLAASRSGQRLARCVDERDQKSRLPSGGSAKTLKAGLIAAGGLAGLTAGSAGISSLKRRSEGTRDNS